MTLPVGLAACSFVFDDSDSRGDDVTSVENTNVKSQAIANCWLYATAGWAESLHKGATARDVDLSEAYWNYWYWYEQITGGDISLSQEIGQKGVTQGGWWGLGVELIRRYGWMYEGDFIAQADAKAKRHEEAVQAINASLSSGALAFPAARRDPKIVREELNRAWKLASAVVDDMERQFPIVSTPAAPLNADVDGGAAPDLPPKPASLASITDRAASRSLGVTRIHAPQELEVLASDNAHNVTLADVVGQRAEGTKVGDGIRVGPEAWTEHRYTWGPDDQARRRAFMKNVQDVLNHRLAVPIGWITSKTAQSGVYQADGVNEGNLGGIHESILVDYEVENVPGFGTLRVDVRETRPEALEAALDDAANVSFFRIKNSWGVDPFWSEEELRQYGMTPQADAGTKRNYLPSKPGYNDIFAAYLDLATPAARNLGDKAHLGLRYALPAKLRFDVPAIVDPRAAAVDAGGGGAKK